MMSKKLILYIILFHLSTSLSFTQTFTRMDTGVVVTDVNASFGCAWIDYDNDNDLDLFVTNGPDEANVLYENLGNNTITRTDKFTDIGNSQGCTWGDYDN